MPIGVMQENVLIVFQYFFLSVVPSANAALLLCASRATAMAMAVSLLFSSPSARPAMMLCSERMMNNIQVLIFLGFAVLLIQMMSRTARPARRNAKGNVCPSIPNVCCESCRRWMSPAPRKIPAANAFPKTINCLRFLNMACSSPPQSPALNMRMIARVLTRVRSMSLPDGRD